ncbi:hypothetical protein GQ53DRAFT_832494 [Thozetella sp. PMI_491]|nr:hypothetical protein GQ53DRAFT_832494 [Thozetella sp. PMI_491]
MHLSAALVAVLAGLSPASATGIMLPLYRYPSAKANDGAANWKPVFNAITAGCSVAWQIIVDPNNGPGNGLSDPNYRFGVAQLNSYPNVRTVGYVRTGFGQRNVSDILADVTTWATWTGNRSVSGIFLDETTTATNQQNVTNLRTVVQYARTKFKFKPVICNFGTKVPPTYYDICDEVVAFENPLTNFAGQSTVNSFIPDTAKRGQAVVMVHSFSGTRGTLANLKAFVSTLKSSGVGWGYFCSKGYDDITSGVASLANVANAFENV